MDHFFDEAARILASAASRRQALRLLAAALAAGVFGVAGAGQAGAQEQDALAVACGKKPCGRNKICCNAAGPKPFCATEGKECCGNKACGKNHGCLEDRCVKSKN